MRTRHALSTLFIAAVCGTSLVYGQPAPSAAPGAGRGAAPRRRPPTISVIVNMNDDWFKSEEGKRTLDNIVSWQGHGPDHAMGWPKSYDTSKPWDPQATIGSWHGVATIDNDATHSELRVLGRAISLEPDGPRKQKLEDSFYKGVDMLLAYQYPNGGWPQRFPTTDQEPYSTHITYNDNAMTSVLEQFHLMAEGSPPYAFVDQAHREKTRASFEKGIDCILNCQIVSNGTLTGWCAQHDEKTLAPAKARAYELPTLSAGEGSEITYFLMTLEHPNDRVKKAIEAAHAWFDKVKIPNKRFQSLRDAQGMEIDRILVDSPGTTVWARFYEIGTDRPVFCGRDSVMKYNLADIEFERRTGYGWYGVWGQKVLDEYPKWKARVGN
jgi:PelA/Pel-15E family pectate lyase